MEKNSLLRVFPELSIVFAVLKLKETGKDSDDLCDLLRKRGKNFFITIGVTLDCNSHFTKAPVIAQDLANYRIHFVHVEDKRGGFKHRLIL